MDGYPWAERPRGVLAELELRLAEADELGGVRFVPTGGLFYQELRDRLGPGDTVPTPGPIRMSLGGRHWMKFQPTKWHLETIGPDGIERDFLVIDEWRLIEEN